METNENGLPDELIGIPMGLAGDLAKKLIFYNQYGRYKSIIQLEVRTPEGTTENCVAYGAYFISSSKKQNRIIEISLGEPSVKGSTNHVWGSSHPICDELLSSIKISNESEIVIN